MGHDYDFNYLTGARLLILIDEVGAAVEHSARVRVIHGTLKLAKLDFLLRYPEYLYQAVKIVSPSTEKYWNDVRAHPMSKYKMGPFEREYYNVFALLDSRGWTETIRSGGLLSRERSFFLTRLGREFIAAELAHEAKWKEHQEVARVIRQFFGNWTGAELKNFLYQQFPKISATGLDDTIPLNPKEAAK